ncbi:MAG TPA: glutamyl-tRNA reductase [Candidatus Eisenbacteria bacterium]|jgi:glutamyl-tRNA reductase
MTTVDGTRLPHVSSRSGAAALCAFSIHHRNAPLPLLERMALSPAALAELHQRFLLHGLEAVVLSTCNRTELYSYAVRPEDHDRAEALLMDATLGESPGCEHVARLTGGEASAHLFRVAAGLESLVLGEAEILGQLRSAIETAQTAGSAGMFLARLFHAALRFGRRARTDTGIGTGALSVASASVRLLAGVHRNLADATVLVVGTGATGLKAARHLKAERVGRLVLLNRTRARAERAAEELNAEPGSLDDLAPLLREADAVLAAVQVDRPLLTAELLRGAGRRSHAPLVLIDLSLPRAIDPACSLIEHVALHNLSDLEAAVAQNRERREAEVPRVETLLEREHGLFSEWAAEFAARPLVAEIRRRAEAIRQEELERALASGSLDPESLDRVTRRLVDRLLHAPIRALRSVVPSLEGPQSIDLARVFGPDDGAVDGPR